MLLEKENCLKIQLCRIFIGMCELYVEKLGQSTIIEKLKKGFFHIKAIFIIYDTENFYVIKQDKIKKIDEEVVISNELVLCQRKKTQFNRFRKS